MNKRRVMLTPFTRGALDGYDKVLKFIEENLPNERPINYQGIFYSSMIQHGVEKFHLVGEENIITNSEFLSQRIITDSKMDKEYCEICCQVDSIFKQYYSSETEELTNNIDSIKVFLADILFSLEMGTSLVCMATPNMHKAKKFLPPDLYYPLSHLFSSIETVNADLPVPKKTVLANDIEKLHEVLLSDLFSSYSNSHLELENNLLPKSTALSVVKHKGSVVNSKFKNITNLQNATLSILPITSKLIDLVFGKLPGIIAEQAECALTKWIENERRLVIYEFNSLFKQILEEKLTILRDLK